ncbi:pimeloyl-ACP methyl ester esterase BioH [Ferrimonas lipolytica]|uniref:Pimeloyl-[acyl-carrier protein] methyl ester esterase n=1 Tax=Ferrimonas lipolytica TaxID=2724191 RepID=A0A6H1UH41_9GAMM|nr:pimeloyl-ACP methyl ester esterase BioH [Ferrimonas lipolytica]QIZ78401.1 pimeloyl-ACP methyl ester esterase BioH [Ferrimonas lipolytica]
MSSTLPSATENIHWCGNGPAIVLLHGWGMNGAVFGHMVPQLVAAGFSVGVAQLPGFGGTSALEPSGDIEAIAVHLWQQIPPQCHLLGWSLGGLVAMKMATQQPQRALSLCTIASSPCFQAQASWPGIEPQVLQRFSEQLLLNVEKTISGFFSLQGMGSSSAREDIRQLKQAVMQLPAAQPSALAGGLTMLAQVDLRQSLPQLPWLRIYGNNDALVPRASIGLVAELAPASRQIIVDKAGHAPFISHLDSVCSEIVRFLRG